MELIDILKSLGYSLTNEGGNNYRLLGYQGLIIKNNFWYQHSTGEGGGVRTLLTKLGEKASLNDNFVRETPKRKSFYGSPLVNNIFLKKPKAAKKYLISKRMITSAFVESLFNEGFIKEDLNQNVCFLGYDDSARLQCISKRSIIGNRKSEESGSNKEYSFSLPAKNPGRSDLIIAEGPVDILSIACLENRKYRKGFFYTHKIASCGPPSKKLRERAFRCKAERIWLAFDQDYAGIKMTKKAQEILRGVAEIRVVHYPLGKDPNESLISQITKK